MYRLYQKVQTLSFVSAMLLLLVLPAAADLTEELAKDLEPISGVLVLPADGQSVIDLDAADGVHAGDFFSVLGEGEKVVHPTTGETLGTLETVKGVLQVEKVEQGFSLARSVKGRENIARGDAIRRYYKIPALFWDYGAKGEKLYRRLKERLPDLDWTAYSEAQSARPAKPGALKDDGVALLFVLTAGQTLEVRDGRFELLFSYAVPSELLATVAASPPSAIVTAPPAPSVSAIVKAAQPSEEGLWYGPDFTDTPVGVEVGNMGGEEGLEVATLFEHRLEIGRFEGTDYQRLAEIDLGYGQKALKLDGADLDGDGILEFYITASSDRELASLIVERTAKGYEVSDRFVPWYFRNVTLAGEGSVLLAQRMGTARQDFSGPIFRVQMRDGKLAEGAPIEVPRAVDLLNFMVLDQTGEKSYVTISEYGKLQVLDPKGDRLWGSSGDFGGSEAFIERTDPNEAPRSGDATRNLYLTARMLQLSAETVLVPVNEGADFIERLRTYKRSSLKAMQWNGHVMSEVWHTKPIDGYLSDFRIADINGDGRKEILMAVVFTRKGLFKKGRSSLVALEMP